MKGTFPFLLREYSFRYNICPGLLDSGLPMQEVVYCTKVSIFPCGCMSQKPYSSQPYS